MAVHRYAPGAAGGASTPETCTVTLRSFTFGGCVGCVRQIRTESELNDVTGAMVTRSTNAGIGVAGIPCAEMFMSQIASWVAVPVHTCAAALSFGSVVLPTVSVPVTAVVAAPKRTPVPS